MTETIRWTLSNGAEATVTVSLERKIRHLGTDDHLGAITRDEGLVVKVEGRVEGMGQLGTHYSERDISDKHRADGVVGRIGKLGIKAEQAEQIKAAIARAKSHPDYVAQVAARAEADARLEAYEAHRRLIERTP